MPRPQSNDYAAFYHNYVQQIKENELSLAFANANPLMETFLHSLPEEKGTYAYAEGKWTLKQLLQHMIDTERIFAFRALWFARKHPSPLTGFDENEFAVQAPAADRTLESLIQEFIALRKSTTFLFESFTQEELNRSGLANNHSITVNALGFVTIGHFLHHQQIIEQRYL